MPCPLLRSKVSKQSYENDVSVHDGIRLGHRRDAYSSSSSSGGKHSNLISSFLSEDSFFSAFVHVTNRRVLQLDRELRTMIVRGGGCVYGLSFLERKTLEMLVQLSILKACLNVG